MVDRNLKRRARQFMDRHSVSYLTALKAVDEPLHELRDLARMPDLELTALNSHFRLTGERSIYDPAFPNIDDDAEFPGDSAVYRRLIESRGLSRFSTRSVLQEMGRRIGLIEGAGAFDIWAYRELQRGGLVQSGELLEPLSHYYGQRFDLAVDAVVYDGHRFGIFLVSMASFIENREHFSAIPVTEKQLAALCSGSSAGEIKLPPVHRTENFQDWEHRSDLIFAKAAYSDAPKISLRGYQERSKLIILFREDPQESGINIEDLGLRWEDFTLRDVSAERWSIHLNRDEIILEGPEGKQHLGASEAVLEL